MTDKLENPDPPADRGLGAWLYKHAFAFALVAVATLALVTWLQPGRGGQPARTDAGLVRGP